MVVQTTFPVPSVIDAQRCTSQPLHKVTPPWPCTTTRKSLPVNNDSIPEQWRLDFLSSWDGRFARLVASSSVSHVKGQWRHASDQGLSRHQSTRALASRIGSIVQWSSFSESAKDSVAMCRNKGRLVMSYLGHYVTGYSPSFLLDLARPDSEIQ